MVIATAAAIPAGPKPANVHWNAISVPPHQHHYRGHHQCQTYDESYAQHQARTVSRKTESALQRVLGPVPRVDDHHTDGGTRYDAYDRQLTYGIRESGETGGLHHRTRRINDLHHGGPLPYDGGSSEQSLQPCQRHRASPLPASFMGHPSRASSMRRTVRWRSGGEGPPTRIRR